MPLIIAAAEEAIDDGVPGVLGIHIEGPFLNEERRGVHDAGKLRQLTHEIVDELSPLPNGCTLLTIAPETVEPELLAELVNKGFIVCAGHSNASQQQVQLALQNGMRGFTHLFNAMSQLTAREPGWSDRRWQTRKVGAVSSSTVITSRRCHWKSPGVARVRTA